MNRIHLSIFELCSRAYNGMEFIGSGVSLSIVKRILEKQNGKIWLESEPAKGSTFLVSFLRDYAA
ncbi:hypothetical protein GS399_20005 [Pedobacter sp. HMF7647]|uniref:histidine kinase n=1 Tax=Hufsiella arboris TaxID=2695275 RepID=A0A7K1YF72_9SPHI|nr:hypothetical protein [Hufsiella arboris]